MSQSNQSDTVTILSYGMGVESTAALVRWIYEPETRPCRLEDLIVVTAQTGDEFEDTRTDVEAHILPLMRKHGIRFVQLARGGYHEADGIVVLGDSRNPTRVFLEGCFKLSDEMNLNGTVPQCGGVHRCAQKYKAWVIENWLDQNLNAPATHAIGYNAEETGRIAKSEYNVEKRRREKAAKVAFGFNSEETSRIERANEYDGLRGRGKRVAFGYNADETKRISKNCEYNTFTRTAFYPLMEWGWNRQACLDYLQKVLGVIWKKSACVFCPFACNLANMEDLAERHRNHPVQVGAALMMEQVALAMNPRQPLYGKKALVDIVTNAGNAAAVADFQRRLDETAWALYRVRRIAYPGKKLRKDGKLKKGVVRRAVERLADFRSRPEALAALVSAAGGLPLSELRGIPYVERTARSPVLPSREEFLTIAPATVPTKSQFGIPDFDKKWASITTLRQVDLLEAAA